MRFYKIRGEYPMYVLRQNNIILTIVNNAPNLKCLANSNVMGISSMSPLIKPSGAKTIFDGVTLQLNTHSKPLSSYVI